MQDYNWVSGRATSVAVDAADPSGNTVLLGGAYGGLWRSTNAGSLSSDPGLVRWQALIDDQPTLAVGAIALQPVPQGSGSNVILVGTGETNGTSDSYYGLGILRTADAGATWTQIQGAQTGQSFLGIGFSKIAFSTANPNLVVAAAAGDNGIFLGREEDGNSTSRGLYGSQDGGLTWNRAVLSDGAVPASATAVIYNAKQGGNGTFYAFVRRHGLYSSTDGQTFTRLAVQPTPGLASANCPAGTNSTGCLIYRGEFAVLPGRNEMYVWIVDVQTDSTPVDEGIWRSTDGGGHWVSISDTGITNCGDDAFGPNSGCGVEDGYSNLELAAIPNASGTDLYAGAVNLYKCTLQGGTICTQGDWINLTHAYGCNPGPLGEPAHVHPGQHGIAFATANGQAPGYFAHDGGISRTLDGYAGLNSGSCELPNQFDSLSQTLGSMTEFVSLSTHPSDADILLGGAQDTGSPKAANATGNSTWQNALGGSGGFSVINPVNPNEWFAENPYLTILKCEDGTACNDSGFFEVVSPATLGGDQGAFDTPYILDPQNSGELLVGTCRMWRVSTSGTAAAQLSNDFDTLGTGVCTGGEINLVDGIAAGGPTDGPGNSSVVYAVTNGYGPLSGYPGGEVWVTLDAGTTPMTNVTQSVNPNGYAISSVRIDSSDPTGQTAYVGIMGFNTPAFPTSHVWKTTDTGAEWTDWTSTGTTMLPDAPVNALLVDTTAGLIYAATDVGVFVSSTGNPSWTEVGPAPASGEAGFLPNAPVTALQLFHPDAGTKTLLASTYGRGIWSYVLLSSADFTNVIADSPQTIFPAQNAAFHGTLTMENGYASPVNLSCTGAAPDTCVLNPAQLTPTASYTLTAAGGVGDYSFSAHAVGTDGNAITRDAPITLHVVDFNLTAPNPNSLTVAQGGTSAASTFQVSAAGSFGGTVMLSCPAGLPSGTACVFSPGSAVSPTVSAPVTVTLTVTAALGALAGGPTTVTIAAMVAGAPQAKTQTFALTVTAPAPDFTLSLAAQPNVTVVNQNVMWSGTLTSVRGYSGSVALTCNGGYPTTCAIMPSTVTPTADGTSFTVTVGDGATGAFNFAIEASDGNLTHFSSTETLTVGTDVAWTNTGNTVFTLLAGQSASYTFSAAPVGGGTFSSAVSFACGGLPALTSCAFNPATIAAGAGTTGVTLTVTTAGPNNGTPGRVHGQRPLREINPGSAANRRVPPVLPVAVMVLAGMVGFLGRRRIPHPPTGWCLSAALALGMVAELSCGGVAGGGGGGGAPDFAILITPVPGSTVVNQNVAWSGALTAANGYAGSVALSCTAGAPQTCTLSPATLVPTAGGVAFTATLGSASIGNFSFKIQATDGALTHATPAEALAVASNVTVAVSPGSTNLFANETGNAWPAAVTQQQFSAIVNNSQNQSVTWSVAGGGGNGSVDANGLYTAPSLVPNPAAVSVTATAAADTTKSGSGTVNLNSAAALGTFQISVTATEAGGAAHVDLVTLTVQ
jgi:hypothetical protein